MHDGTFLGLQGVHRAQIVGLSPDGRARLLVPALGETPLVAQTLVPLSGTSVGRFAAVTMMDDQPLILGLLQPPAVEVAADGEKLVLQANREVMLKCGKASIHLAADGRVTIRGTEILSRSDGTNRVQGASIQLN